MLDGYHRHKRGNYRVHDLSTVEVTEPIFYYGKKDVIEKT